MRSAASAIAAAVAILVVAGDLAARSRPKRSNAWQNDLAMSLPMDSAGSVAGTAVALRKNLRLRWKNAASILVRVASAGLVVAAVAAAVATASVAVVSGEEPVALATVHSRNV